MAIRRLLPLLFPILFSACVATRSATAPEGVEQEQGEDARAGELVLLVSNLPDLIFQGVTRATAKLTMVTGQPVSYASITAVTTLAQPAVNSTSPRTGVENNLAQFSAYLYAYNLPADNDFHLIIGDTPNFISGTTNLINVEVSGRPNSADVTFKAVRTAFLAKIGNPTQMAYSTYVCVPVPIAVTVSGGPFWDTSHPKGGSGTSTCNGGVSMKTINGWELHPVTSIN
jgi:hypothetical protein